jgi:hypothetical protein
MKTTFLAKIWIVTALTLVSITVVAAERSVSLFNGQDVSGWRSPTGTWRAASKVSLDPADPTKFVISPGAGILVNTDKAPTVDLITTQEFADLEVHVEFCIPKQSNSGVYLMGRYEVQIFDSFGVEKSDYPGSECGGIYPRWIDNKGVNGHSPRVNASKAPGEWQTFDIAFRAPRFDSAGKKIENARFLKVTHNGKLVQENIDLSGPTRSAHWDDEKPLGPILLQGDHGPVAFRNLRVTAIGH